MTTEKLAETFGIISEALKQYEGSSQVIREKDAAVAQLDKANKMIMILVEYVVLQNLSQFNSNASVEELFTRVWNYHEDCAEIISMSDRAELYQKINGLYQKCMELSKNL